MDKNVFSRLEELIRARNENFLIIQGADREIEKIQKQIATYEKARIVFGEMLAITQEETKKRIEGLVTLAIRSVFEDREFKFQLNFERKNNKMVIIPVVNEFNEEYSPEEIGGSLVDIISIALRIILWSMDSNKKRNVFILDEPFRFTGKLISKVGEMIKFLATELNVQMIIVSHEDRLIDICDRVYRIHREKNQSKIVLIKDDKKLNLL